MRIRRSASRLLGSAYSAAAAAPTAAVAPPLDLLPPPHQAPCSAPESCGLTGFSSPSASSAEPCELSHSPWDLIADLSLSDQKVEDELVDKYFVHVTTRSSWLFSATMPATSTKKKLPAACGDSTQLRREVVKKAAMKVVKKTAMNKEKKGEAKKSKVKKEENEDGEARAWKCKKNDGKQWHCNRLVSQPNTLCEYHSVQKRSYLNADFEFYAAKLEEAAAVPVQAAASKSSISNKPRKKKKKPANDFSATEGFYYYAGFGPFRSKRQCRSGGMNEPLPEKQEEDDEAPEDASHPTVEAVEIAECTYQQAASRDDVFSCDNDIAGIAGVDEESSDDDYDGIGIAGCNMDGTVDPQASSGEGKRKIPWKRWRKPVKARSLMSLM